MISRHAQSHFPGGVCVATGEHWQRISEPLIRCSHPHKSNLHVVPQHQLLRVRMQIHLLVNPLGNRVAAQVVLQQRQRHDQRQQLLAIVLDEAQELQPTGGAPTFGRRCPCSAGALVGSPPDAGALSAWARWLIRLDTNDKNSQA